MESLLNMKAIDLFGLKATAHKLHRVNLDQSVKAIFRKLVQARCEYLANHNLLFRGES